MKPKELLPIRFQIRKKSGALLILITSFSVLQTYPSQAANIIETFGNPGNCGVQTPGMTVTDGGSPMVSGSFSWRGTFNSDFAGQFRTIGCHISLQQIKADVVLTFPSTSRPSQFSFSAGAVDGVQQGLITYTDSTTDTFTITNATPSVGETRTVIGNGKIIQSFTIVYFTTGIGTDYWFLDNLTWTPGTLIPTTVGMTVATIGAFKGIVNNLTITSSGLGKVTVFANEKKVAGCIARSISTSIICQWKPAVKGSVELKTVFTPVDSGAYLPATAVIRATVAKRNTLR
jgi:hypothetical protein